MELRKKVVQGSFWNIIGMTITQAVKIIAMIVIARLLTPRDFAIAGLSTTITQMVIILGGFGFGEALVAKKDITKESCHSVFWAMAVIKVILCLVICFLASTFAAFYHNQELIKPIIFIGIGLVFSIGNIVPSNLLYREMRFFELNVINFITAIISVIIGIFMAVKGFGYWAIIVPAVIVTPIKTIMQSILAGYWPRLKFSWKEFRLMMNFGFSVLGTKITRFFADNCGNLILGRFIPAPIFGIYYFATEKARLVIDTVAPQLENTLFPAFSKIQSEILRLRDKCLEATQMICWLLYPIHIILILLAKPLILIVFGEQWAPATQVFQFFCAYAFTYYLYGSAQFTMYALNKPQSLFFFEVAKLVIIAPILIYAGFKSASIEQIAIWLLIAMSTLNIGIIIYIYHHLKTTLLLFINHFLTLLIASGILVVLGWFTVNKLNSLNFTYNIYNVIFLGTAGVIVYFAALTTFEKTFFKKIKSLLMLIK